MRLFLFSIYCLLFCSLGYAQTDVVKHKIRALGETTEVVLTQQDVSVNKVVLWYVHKGNESVPIILNVTGPDNLRVTGKAKFLGNANPEVALDSSVGWWNLKWKRPDERRKRLMLVVRGSSPATAPAFGGSICDLMPRDQIMQMIRYYEQILGIDLTYQQFCSGNFGGPTPTPDPNEDPDEGDADATSLLRKDACRPAAKSAYLVALTFDLSHVDPLLRQNGATISAKVKSKVYQGDKQSSVKPVSEGRYAPRPLLLMRALSASMGFFFGGGVEEKMFFNRWARKKPAKDQLVDVPQYLFYRGMIFAEGLPGAYFTGGRATATLATDTKAYSICVGMGAYRQKFNGYP